MTSTVFFANLNSNKHSSQLTKITKLLHKCTISDFFKKDELIAIKVHFGELGNTSFLRPIFLRPIVEELKKLKTKPYITDTNTLYVGMRVNSVDHLHNANWNGFGYSTLQVPVIIADGLRGENSTDYQVNLPLSKQVYLASDIINADGMICVSHVKAHEISCIGGAIKNISMGCASRKGKLDMHSQTRPFVDESICTACGRCVSHCQTAAIEINKKATITEKCVGCARCIAVCPEEAIQINWNTTTDNTQRKMVEYAFGVKKAIQSKIIFLNIITDVSPACDCYPGNDKAIVADIGYLASTDPVALDKASYDLICKTAGYDPMKKIYPHINPDIQFEHAEKINLGTTNYNLIEID